VQKWDDNASDQRLVPYGRGHPAVRPALLHLYEAVFADCERVLGPDHPDTLTSRNNLASAYQAAGDLGRAIPLHEAVFADCERVLGPNHRLTTAIRANFDAARHRQS
jgi:hypothetical protein